MHEVVISSLRRATTNCRLPRRNVPGQLVSLPDMKEVIWEAVVDLSAGSGILSPNRLHGNICHHASGHNRGQYPVETPEAFCSREQKASVLSHVIDQPCYRGTLYRIEKPTTVECGCGKVEECRQRVTASGAKGDSDGSVRHFLS